MRLFGALRIPFVLSLFNAAFFAVASMAYVVVIFEVNDCFGPKRDDADLVRFR